MSNIDPIETLRTEDFQEDIPAKTEKENTTTPDKTNTPEAEKERAFKEGLEDNSNTERNRPQQK